MNTRPIKQPFILTPEIPYGDPRREEIGNIWYPFWNQQSGVNTYAYDNYLQVVLWQTENEIASRCEFADEIMASRQKFRYRVPSTPMEEMFCRGQF